MKYFIVGIDPGLNTAVVLLSLDGKLIDSMVEKNSGEERVISFISSHGTASLIASDVSPPPKFVVKISSILNVPIFYPLKSMSKAEKDSFAIKTKDPHIKDAYAAAMKAYNTFSNKLRQIDKKKKEEAELYKHNFLRGKRLHDLAKTNKNKRRFKKTR